MAKYIDADKLKNNLLQSGAICDFGLFLIEKQPAVDVQKVKHGFWEEGKVRGQFALICSKCKCNAGVTYDYDYCPNCGAKMDGKNGEQNDT